MGSSRIPFPAGLRIGVVGGGLARVSLTKHVL